MLPVGLEAAEVIDAHQVELLSGSSGMRAIHQEKPSAAMPFPAYSGLPQRWPVSLK
jgi:hypothetical protein